MTLIISAVAALVATVLWYARTRNVAHRSNSTHDFGALALMLWGASLMWCVDGIANLVHGEAFIELRNTAAMLDDALLGVVVVIAALAVWFVVCRLQAMKNYRT